MNSKITSSTTPLDLLDLLQNTLVKLEDKNTLIEEKNTLILSQTEQMHKLLTIDSKLDQVLSHQQEAKHRWQHWGDKKKKWCEWFNKMKDSDGQEKWHTSIGDWMDSLNSNATTTQNGCGKNDNNLNGNVNIYPDVDYNNLFFEKSVVDTHVKIDKETHSFQTSRDVNTDKDKRDNTEPDNIKRSRAGLVNKVMDSTDAKNQEQSLNHDWAGLVKKCPENHKLKYNNNKPKF